MSYINLRFAFRMVILLTHLDVRTTAKDDVEMRYSQKGAQVRRRRGTRRTRRQSHDASAKEHRWHLERRSASGEWAERGGHSCATRRPHFPDLSLFESR